MIKVAAFGGLPRSGKTSLISSLLSLTGTDDVGVMLNNAHSLADIQKEHSGMPAVSFPLTAPCGRARQFSGTFEKFVANNVVGTIICEPAGSCTETMAPFLSPLVAFQSEKMKIAPLFNVLKGTDIIGGVSKRTADGLKMWQQIDESDVTVIAFSDLLKDDERDTIRSNIMNINDVCTIIFASSLTREGVKEVAELLISGSYQRALTI
ncbi:MAG: hypothetical protein FWG19_03505 [Methanomassiliicoccaceae archaeon]|nr:hypothetical protein [Methanomassiliicoccaceae archaeon]